MVQLAAALLFALAAGLGIVVILGMFRANGDAILSALAGEGAFPIAASPSSGPAPRAAAPRRPVQRRDAPRPLPAIASPRPLLRRAA